MAFSRVIETLAKCLHLKRIPPDKCRFERLNEVFDARVIPTVGSLTDPDATVVSMYLDEEPIAAVVYLNNLSLYVRDFQCVHLGLR
jgi:hypothetical protein